MAIAYQQYTQPHTFRVEGARHPLAAINATGIANPGSPLHGGELASDRALRAIRPVVRRRNMRGKPIVSADVWPQLMQLFNLPELSVSGEVVIRLDPRGLVKVDIGGVIPRHAPEPVETTTMGDRLASYAMPGGSDA